MPNWCSNHATFTAVTDEAKKLLSDYRDYLSINGNSKFFGFFLPIPQDLRDTTAGFIGGEEGEILKKKEENNIAKYGFKNWYDFSNAKWGTKWDVDLDQSCLSGDTIIMTEETAWSPPIEFYRHMEDLGFEVEATYHESGVGFYGSYSDGCDNSESAPELNSVGRDLFSIFSGSGHSYKLVDFDINNVKTGDVLTAESGDTFIYISHDVFTPSQIMDDNPGIDDEDLWNMEPTYGEIASITEDIYVLNVSRNQSVPGTETCIIFSDKMDNIVFPEG